MFSALGSWGHRTPAPAGAQACFPRVFRLSLPPLRQGPPAIVRGIASAPIPQCPGPSSDGHTSPCCFLFMLCTLRPPVRPADFCVAFQPCPPAPLWEKPSLTLLGGVDVSPCSCTLARALDWVVICWISAYACLVPLDHEPLECKLSSVSPVPAAARGTE